MKKCDMLIGQGRAVAAVVTSAEVCDEGFDGAATATMRKRLKREHGADDPNGAETVAAPATVSGKRIHTMSLAISREDVDAPRPASQETCHRTTINHNGRGVPMEKNWFLRDGHPSSCRVATFYSGPIRRRRDMAQSGFPTAHDNGLHRLPFHRRPRAVRERILIQRLNRSIAALGEPLDRDFSITGTVCMAAVYQALHHRFPGNRQGDLPLWRYLARGGYR